MIYSVPYVTIHMIILLICLAQPINPKPEGNQFTIGVISAFSDFPNWEIFDSQVDQLKDIGVNCMEVDVSWRKVEPANQSYDWSLYQKLNDHLKEKGIGFAPILTVHYVPHWVWNAYPDIHLKNEKGDITTQYLSIWHPQTKPLLCRFIKNFAETFGQDPNIYVVFISLGYFGEIKFPTEPAAYWGYDLYAIKDFKRYVEEKYNSSLTLLNLAWNSNFQSWEAISPPRPPGKDRKGADFIEWYKVSLVNFEDWMLNFSSQYFERMAVKVAPRENSEINDKMGIDLNAQIRVAAKYNAIVTYGYIENFLIAEDIARIAHSYNLTLWAENLGISPTNFVRIAKNLLEYGYDGWFYINWSPTVLDLLFSGKTPTKIFDKYATTIKALQEGRIPEIEEERESILLYIGILSIIILIIFSSLILTFLHKQKEGFVTADGLLFFEKPFSWLIFATSPSSVVGWICVVFAFGAT